MNQLLQQKRRGKPRILVAPLDWGLGHTTRCIPIIKELLEQDCEVWLAGEGAQEILLKKEFSHLEFLSLPGYRIRYARSAIGLLQNIFFQTPKVLRAIKKENEWLNEKMEQYNFDAVISDNRYGFYHKSTPCIFITHQLTIKSPLGKWSEKILQKRNYRYINHFAECWVPDEEGKNNLAGELSHPQKKPRIPIKYLGILSRFNSHSPNVSNGHLLIILSGPEPQRTILENIIVKQIAHYNGTATVLRGLPASTSLIPSTNSLLFYNHLPADELNQEMQKAEFVIARCGYSTVMDLMRIQKKSILIPTPGQTEQEYLGRYLSKKQFTISIEQKGFSLENALEKARSFSYRLASMNNEPRLKLIIEDFITGLK